MSDEPTMWAEVGEALAASATLTAAAWGAFGGAAAAISIEVDRRAVIRQVALGAMVAAGVGTLATALVVALGKLPATAIPVGAGLGGAHFLVGVFGPAIIERRLRRLTDLQDAESAKNDGA